MMKSRILFVTALLVGAFVYATSVAKWSPRQVLARIQGAASSSTAANGPLWSGPGTIGAAGLSSDENNNIEI